MAGCIDFTGEALSAHLKRNAFVAELHCFEAVDSTNTVASQLALAGAREGVVVVADAQLKGRGRLERAWHSPPGANLYISTILRPKIEPAMAPQITLMAGVAVAELFSACCPGAVSIKWPNDVLLRGKKACGILTEMRAAAGRIDFIVLGMGLNVNMNPEDFDPVLRETATSLKIQTGREHDRPDVMSRLFESIEKWYMIFLREGFAGLRETWLGYARLLGRTIRVAYKDEFQTGVVTGIDDSGAILISDERGAVLKVIAGDIHLLEG